MTPTGDEINTPYATDEQLMRHCFRLAEDAREIGDGPFGALITDESGQIIAKAGNTTSSESSVIYHAEINVIQQAEYKRGKGKLRGCILYSSAEPCVMCASAIIWSGLNKVVYGVSIPSIQKNGVKQIEIGCREIFNHSAHQINIKGPFLEKEGLELFTDEQH